MKVSNKLTTLSKSIKQIYLAGGVFLSYVFTISAQANCIDNTYIIATNGTQNCNAVNSSYNGSYILYGGYTTTAGAKDKNTILTIDNTVNYITNNLHTLSAYSNGKVEAEDGSSPLNVSSSHDNAALVHSMYGGVINLKREVILIQTSSDDTKGAGIAAQIDSAKVTSSKKVTIITDGIRGL